MYVRQGDSRHSPRHCGEEGYFASEDTPVERMEKRKALAAKRMKDYASGTYMRAGGVIDPLPEDVSWFVKDYHAYYKCPRVIT